MKAANLAKSYLTDYSAAGIVAAYYGLQLAVPTMPDLPEWAVVTLMVAAVARGLVLQLFVDRDGDGKIDRPTLTAVSGALEDGLEDAQKAQKAHENAVSEDGPAAS